MNKYEHHLSLLPRKLVPGPNRVYTGANMNEVVELLQAAGFRWVAGYPPATVDSAIRVDEEGHMWQAPIEYYETRMPELEVITL